MKTSRRTTIRYTKYYVVGESSLRRRADTMTGDAHEGNKIVGNKNKILRKRNEHVVNVIFIYLNEILLKLLKRPFSKL